MWKIPTDKEILNSIKFFRPYGKRLHIKVIKDIHIFIWDKHFIIPKTLESDGASVPRFIFWIDRYDKRWLLWALLHDYMFRTQFVSFFYANRIFFKGVWIESKKYAIIFGIAVSTFGIIAWFKNKRNLLKFPEIKKKLKK